jgi:tetratricopeptide (TPR) repeat protein
MKKVIIATGMVGILFMSSCGNHGKKNDSDSNADSIRARAFRKPLPIKAQFAATIKQTQDSMRAGQDKPFNPNVANGLIKAYLDYATAFPEDSLAPDYYYRAGEIATRAENYDQAIFLFEKIADKYPEYKYVVEAQYEEAMIYDSKLPGQTEKAKKIYETIIKNYPKHKLAEDAKIAITHLGKTDEELVKEFEKKNHLKSN